MRLEFNFKNRYYTLSFNAVRIMKIRGDSATGKSLMCDDLRMASSIDEELKRKVKIIDYRNQEAMDSLQNIINDYEYVIIDNADILINKREGKDNGYKKKITDSIKKSLFDSKNYWILIGREFFDCDIPTYAIGVLNRKEKKGNHYFNVDYTQK